MSDPLNFATDVSTLQVNTLNLSAATGAYLNDPTSAASKSAMLSSLAAETTNIGAVGSDLGQIIQNSPTAETIAKYAGISGFLASIFAVGNDLNTIKNKSQNGEGTSASDYLSLTGDVATFAFSGGRLVIEAAELPAEAGIAGAVVGLGGAASLFGGAVLSATGSLLSYSETLPDDIVVNASTVTYSNGYKGSWSDNGDDGNGNPTESTYQTFDPSTGQLIGSVTVPIADKQALSSGGTVITAGGQQELVGSDGSLTHVDENGTPTSEDAGMQRVFTTAGGSYAQAAQDGEVDISGGPAGNQQVDFNGTTPSPYQASQNVDTSATEPGTQTNISLSEGTSGAEVTAQTTGANGISGKVDNTYSSSGQLTQSTGSIDGLTVDGESAPLSIEQDGEGGLIIQTPVGSSDTYSPLLSGQQAGGALEIQGNGDGHDVNGDGDSGMTLTWSGSDNTFNISNAAQINFTGGSQANTLSGNGNAIDLASGGGLSVTGQGNSISASGPTTIAVSDAGSPTEYVSASGSTVHVDDNSNINLAGDNTTVNMDANASVGVLGGTGITVNASDDIVNMASGTNATIVGSGDEANLTGSTGFNVSVSNGTVGMWDGVQGILSGDNNAVVFGTAVSLAGGGNNDHFYFNGDSGGDHSASIEWQGVGDRIDVSNDTNINFTEGSSSDVVVGDNNSVAVGTGVSLAGGGDNDHFYFNGDPDGEHSVAIEWQGVGDRVDLSNSTNINFTEGSSSDILSGDNNDVSLGTGVSLAGGGDNDHFYFNGDPDGGGSTAIEWQGVGDRVDMSNMTNVNFTEGSSSDVVVGDNNSVSLGTGVSLAGGGNNDNFIFNGDPDGDRSAAIEWQGLNDRVDLSDVTNINFTEGSSGDQIYGNGNSVTLGTGVDIVGGGVSDTYNVNGDPDGGHGINLTLYGTSQTVNLSGSNIIAGASSSATVTGGIDDIHLNGNDTSMTEINGGTTYVPSGETDVYVYGNNLTIYAGTGDSVNVYGSNDVVQGGSGDTFDVFGADDDVYADDSDINFAGGYGGDDVYGSGDGGDNWGGYGYYGGGGWGYYGYGGYAFSRNPSSLGTDIGSIAANDVSLGDKADAITAQAARLQAAATSNSADAMQTSAVAGPKWSGEVITWSVAPGAAATATQASAALSQQFEADVEEAFATWGSASGLTFEEVSDPTQADIRVGFKSFDTTNSNVLGYTQIGAQNGQILPHVNISLENPEDTAITPDSTGALAYNGTDTEMSQLLLHEIGHALGLADSSDPTSIMAATLSGTNRTLDAADMAAIQNLYSTSDANNSTTMAASLASPVASGALTATSAANALGHGSTFRADAEQIINAVASFGSASAGSLSLSPTTTMTNYDHSLAAAA